VKKLFVLVILALLLLSCSDESSESGELFSLKVVDSAGNPLPGIMVSINNAFSNGQDNDRADTIISLVLSADGNAKLDIFDLQNNLVRNLGDNNFNADRVYNYWWDGLNNDSEPANIGGTNIFICKMIATKLTGEILHDDNISMCMHYPLESDLSVVGSTDEEGTYCLDNQLAFPHLFNLGEQPRYDEDANYNGTFTLSDSINIKLTDPETEEYLIFTVAMSSSRHNQYNMIWENPQTADVRADISGNHSQPVMIERENSDDDVTFEYGLRQNYPNPFN